MLFWWVCVRILGWFRRCCVVGCGLVGLVVLLCLCWCVCVVRFVGCLCWVVLWFWWVCCWFVICWSGGGRLVGMDSGLVVLINFYLLIVFIVWCWLLIGFLCGDGCVVYFVWVLSKIDFWLVFICYFLNCWIVLCFYFSEVNFGVLFCVVYFLGIWLVSVGWGCLVGW